jgi:hypothetical protein
MESTGREMKHKCRHFERMRTSQRDSARQLPAIFPIKKRHRKEVLLVPSPRIGMRAYAEASAMTVATSEAAVPMSETADSTADTISSRKAIKLASL